MKRSLMFTVIVFLGLLLCGTGFGAEEEKKAAEERVTGSASMGVFNKYIFRGYEMSKGSVVIQPSLSASYKGFSASFWGNIDTNQHVT